MSFIKIVSTQVPVPQEITSRQGKHELIDLDMYDSSIAMIDAIVDPKERAKARVSWDNHVWDIDDPLVRQLWVAHGKTEQELQDAFRRAKLR